MKYISAMFGHLRGSRTVRQNLRLLLRYAAFLAGLVTVYSVLFHLLMQREGQEHSWLTGFYWTLVTMTTLGYGDITFTSDLGRAFSALVLMSGLVSLLVLLPFTFIEFFYAPFLRAQSLARAPRELPVETRGHVILTNYDPVTASLIEKLISYKHPYVLLVNDLPRALELVDRGLKVVVGPLDDPETYRCVRVEKAELVAATGSDVVNTNVTFTVRERDKGVRIIATANSADAAEILGLAGATRTFHLADMLGRSLVRRMIGGDARAHVIGEFDDLLIAEATAAGTPLIGKTLAQSRLRELAGVNIVGIWERGAFHLPRPDTRVTASTVLVFAGSIEHMRKYDELFCIYNVTPGRVVIIGGGRVGRAAARALAERHIDYRIVDRNPERIRDPQKYLLGSAAERDTLERAGLMEAPAVMITTHDDDTNIYLTIYCRLLRPDIQIISRATHDRNVPTLHRAGADFVMSYASMGSNTIFNFLERSDILMIAEGLNVFRLKAPPTLVGKTLAETRLREETGCNVIAFHGDDAHQINPDPTRPIQAGLELILIGSVEAEKRFLDRYRQSGA
jgi:voltage-gated potassium channel